MRLATLTLERYGPFERLELPFDPAPARLNLIVAPNGYGKSVIRTAIGDLLFGIPERTGMDFRFGTERMRLVADVVHADGRSTLIRRKGRGNTLAYADGAPVPPEAVRAMLGSADRDVFQELFGLDTELLRRGGQELIRSQGRLGQVLFAAGGGMGRVRDLLGRLELQRDELGRAATRHKSRPIWAALSAWEQANADLRQAAIRPDGWARMDSAATDSAAALRVLLDEQTRIAAERNDLQIIGAVRPWLERLHLAEGALADAGQVPDLDPGFAQGWRKALDIRAQAAHFAKAADDALAAARQARADLRFNPAWLAEADLFAALDDARPVALNAGLDLPSVQAELDEASLQATAVRQALGWDGDVILPPPQAVQAGRRHLQALPALRADLATGDTRLEEAARQTAATEAALASLPDAADTSLIADLARGLRVDGAPAARLTQARRRLRDAQAGLAAALAAIPDNPLAEAALGQTAAPSEPRLEAADRAITRAEAALAQALRDRDNHASALQKLSTRLAELEQRTMLPPPDALDVARARRDALCAALSAPDPPHAVALDRDIRAADAVADALIAHGQEVAEAATLRRDCVVLEANLRQDGAIIAAATTEATSASEDLAAMARAAGGVARDMPALRAFLRARADAVVRRGERDAAASALADLTAELTCQGAALAAAMAQPAPQLELLDTLLLDADRRVDAARSLIDRRDGLKAEMVRQADARAAAEDAVAKVKQAMSVWQAQWASIAMALNRPAAEAPQAADDALSLIEELRAHEARRDKAQLRVNDMMRAVERLRAIIASLAPLAPELVVLPLVEAAGAFQRRFQTEREQATRCRDADERVAAAVGEQAARAVSAEDAARRLAGLRAALHAQDDAAAERQLQRAGEIAQARADRVGALRELARQGGGLAVDDIASRAARTTEADDAARLAAIVVRQQALAAEIDTAREAAAAASAALTNASAGTDAADAAQRRQEAQAVLARTAQEALLLHATHALLQQALTRQASHATNPLLARISAAFRTITGGEHAGVAIEENGADQSVVVLDADGKGGKSLDKLSEGTCDQLYLALRIAALDDYASVAPALPLVADDVLQTSDDRRTLATLNVLLDLSAHVQVIALTHHDHIAALAGAFPAGAVNILRLTR